MEDFVKKVGVISKMNSQKNQNLKEDKEIPKNTQVYYRNNLRSGKQEPRFIGPATIKNIIDGKYQLVDVLNHEIPNLFSRDQLKTTMVMNQDHHKFSHIKKIHSRNEQNEWTFWSVFVFVLCFCYKTKSRPEPSVHRAF